MRRRVALSSPAVCCLSFLAGAALIAALAAPPASAAPGELDPSFGAGGSVRLFPSQEKTALRAVAVQSDDRIVLAGADFETQSLIVVRLLRNGTLDPSFGSGGVVHTPFPGSSGGGLNAVAIQPDGKIVVAGEAKGTADFEFLAMRYDSSGALDPSFGDGNGIELVPLAGTNDRAEAVEIGTGGRILLTGEARTLTNEGVAAEVAVLQPDGKPDPSFDTDGVTTVQTTGAEKADEGSGIAEQADGKILIADESGNGAGHGFTIVRLLPSGSLDPEFGGAGYVNTPIPTATNPGAEGRSADVLALPDGRIVAAGYGYDEVGSKKEVDSKFAAVRYLADGKLDPSFGAEASGIFTKQVADTFDDTGRWVALTPSGKLILAGPYSAGAGLGDDSFAAMRLEPGGALDPSYGAGGLALRGPTAPFGDYFEGAALDSRERVVVVSRAYEGNGGTSVEVSRFLGDPGPEPATPAPPLPAPEPPAPSSPKPAPHARMKKVPRKLATTKLSGFAGTASDAGGTLAKVQVAVVALQPGGARASRAGGKGGGKPCNVLMNARGRFKTVRAKKGKPCPLRWLTASGKAKWRFRLKTVLPVGPYVVYSRAVDASGRAESSFSRKAGNRYAFRLLAPRSAARGTAR